MDAPPLENEWSRTLVSCGSAVRISKTGLMRRVREEGRAKVESTRAVVSSTMVDDGYKCWYPDVYLAMCLGAASSQLQRRMRPGSWIDNFKELRVELALDRWSM